MTDDLDRRLERSIDELRSVHPDVDARLVSTLVMVAFQEAVEVEPDHDGLVELATARAELALRRASSP